MCSLRCVGDCVRTINNTSAEGELRCFSPPPRPQKGWRLGKEGEAECGRKRREEKGEVFFSLSLFSSFGFHVHFSPLFSPVARRFSVRQKVGFSSAGVCVLVSIRFTESVRSL